MQLCPNRELKSWTAIQRQTEPISLYFRSKLLTQFSAVWILETREEVGLNMTINLVSLLDGLRILQLYISQTKYLTLYKDTTQYVWRCSSLIVAIQ